MPSLVIYGSILTDCLGSQYFDVHHNLFLYGTGGLKSNYGGHDNRYVDVITRTSHYESFTVSGTGYNDNQGHGLSRARGGRSGRPSTWIDIVYL